MRTMLWAALAAGLLVGCGKKPTPAGDGPDREAPPAGDPAADNPGQGEPVRPDEPPIPFGGWADYDRNPIEADGKYKGKRVVWEDVRVDVISRDAKGRPYLGRIMVMIAGRELPEPNYYFYLRSDAEAAGLKPNQTVAITGRCLGYRKDGVDRIVSGMDWRVEFVDCTVAKKK